MTIQHNTITGTDLHEPKGAAAAAANKVYVANGSASGAWSTLTTSTMALPKGKFHFYNVGSPYTHTWNASPTIVAPTTIASGLGSLVTEATTARLTYTGTLTAVVKLDFDITVQHAVGSDVPVLIAVHKNGTVIAGSESYADVVTADATHIVGSCLVSAATNDYFEVYADNTTGAGDMTVTKLALTLTAT
tara:strand:+ start:570 stop:1139 length:570 start_codon:yes stop_codon:yes gene_type:complete